MKWSIASLLFSVALVGCAVGPGEMSEGKLSTNQQALQGAKKFPDLISLPNGFAPEGIARGYGTDLYSGSLANGSIVKVNLRTGKYKTFVAALGRPSVGMNFDRRHNRLFVAGGPSGFITVYHGSTGKQLAEYKVPTARTFVNDIIVTRNAAYATDSFNAVFYKIPFGRRGKLPAASGLQTISLSGDFTQSPGFSSNGIEATPNGKHLIIVQSTRGELYRVSPNSGNANLIDLGGASVSAGDGILLEGQTLYVLRNRLGEVAVVKMSNKYTQGKVIRILTNSNFDVATTLASFGSSLYAVNARFGTPVTPDTTYQIVRFSKR